MIGDLQRISKTPILEPRPETSWESVQVMNPGAIRLGGVSYFVYRASGDDGLARWGLFTSEDGSKVDSRSDAPVFVPTEPYELPSARIREKMRYEKGGCEDPRFLGVLDGRIYVSYAANGGPSGLGGSDTQLALASIDKEAFVSLAKSNAPTSEWTNAWKKEGLAFPGYDKDAIVLPERVAGKWALIHRPYPDIRITFADELKIPWEGPPGEFLLKADHVGCDKIGVGSQALKTEFGWLLICHGKEDVDRGDEECARVGRGGVLYSHGYFLFTLVLDLTDPRNVLHISPSILEPELEWEEYGWVNHVVFCCGAVPQDKDSGASLDEEDVIHVPYGAADRVIGMARARVGDLIPEKVRAEARKRVIQGMFFEGQPE